MAKKPGVITVGGPVAAEPKEPGPYPGRGLTDTDAASPDPAPTKTVAFPHLPQQQKPGLRKKSPGPDYFIG